MFGNNQSGPSQPEWRLPPRRPVPHSETALPPPPSRPPVTGLMTGATYTPASFGPISGSSGNSNVSPVSGSAADPRTWGVRYNQQVHAIHAPPPLPPRPSSTNEQPYAYTQAQLSQPPAASPGLPPSASSYGVEASADARIQSASNHPPPYSALPDSETVPPPPPKIPEGYQNPSIQQSSPSSITPPAIQSSRPPVVTGSLVASPPASLNTHTAAQATSSALGPGTPSDWEHFGPTPGEVDDGAWFPPRRSEPQAQESIQTTPGFSTGLPNSPLVSPIDNSPRIDTAQQASATASHGERVVGPRRNDSISPISPIVAQGIFTLPARTDSVNSGVSFSDRAESIDNVIDAWVRPLSPANKLARSTSANSTSQTQNPSQHTPATLIESPEPATSSPAPVPDLRVDERSNVAAPESRGRVATKESDPYEDLDPWFKSSLTRYVAMLRKEAVADSDEERYKIFTAFIAKETKLREILYNIESEAPVGQKKSQTPAPTQERVALSAEAKGNPVGSGLIPVETEALTSPSLTTDGNDEDTGSEYSAGGRPLLGKQARRGSQWMPNFSTLPPGRIVTKRITRADSLQCTIRDSVEKQAVEPLTTNPPRPIYTPFRYTEGPQRGSDNLSFDRPAYQAYSDLRQASAGSGRVMSNAPLSTSRSRSSTLTTPVPTERDETFLGLIRHKSNAYQANTHLKVTPLSLLPESLKQGRPQSLIEDLRSLVWTPLDKQSGSSWHITTREDLESFPDDFSYIQKTIDDWEESAKARRQKLDQERQVRQENSESQIDNLFNEKEIGYADINTLEEDFRQAEARVQLDEERHEVDDFISHVFNPLDERLKNEISALRRSYDSALAQLDRDQKGNEPLAEQCSPSVTMKLVNEIHSKLETRFQKRLDLALDCERRRKKSERRPLVFMGDMSSLRKLDGEFDLMEKRNILEAAKDRDERANRLMDSFDDAILYGLGMNQSLLDELASKAARLDPTTLRASGFPDSEIEHILKSATSFAAALQANSEAILRCSGVADMILNDADYNVSVAEARYADSEPEIFQRLEDEKKKEDDKIQSDLDAKLLSIQKSPREIESTIQRLIDDLRKTPRAMSPAFFDTEGIIPASQRPDVPSTELRSASTAPSQTPAPGCQTPNPEGEHQERLRIALENAKKRNAVRANQ